MKTRDLIIAFFIGLLIYKCGGETPVVERIAGKDSKVWQLDNEKRSRYQFYLNGTYTVNSDDYHTRGTWGYDTDNNTLSLREDWQLVTGTYHIEEISDDQMELEGNSGYEMIFEAVE